jgi:hypothetical protein
MWRRHLESVRLGPAGPPVCEALEPRVLLTGLPWANARQIVADTVVPRFPDVYFDVTDPQYGAVGDGSTDDTDAFRAAIADCSAQGGGHVVVPAGVYSTGAKMDADERGPEITREADNRPGGVGPPPAPAPISWSTGQGRSLRRVLR